MRLQSKQIAALLAMALLPLAVATVLLVRSNTWQLSQQAREFRLAVADSAKRATLAFVDEASTELATLGGAFLRTELGLERIKALVQATLKGTRRVNQVALYAKSGALALSYRAAEAKVGVTPPKSLPTSLVQIAPTRDFLYLGVVWQQGRPFLPIVMALFKDAARKEAIGFVYTAVDLTPLSAVMRELSVRRFDKEPGYIQLIAPDFRFLAHGVAANVGQSASSAVKTSGINFKSDVGVTTDDRIGGKDVLVALLPVIEPGWAIVVAQPRDAAYAAVRNIKRTALFVGAGCLVLAIFGGWLIGRRLSRPILRIAAAAKRVATGDFRARVEARGKDEVGELAQSFNQMSGDLETYKQTLIDETAIRSNLSRYLSPDLVEQIVAHKQQLALGGERREVTVLFADVVAFTPMAENLPPETIVKILNELFTYLTEIIFRHGGTVDKFLGDCVMAVFGAPNAHDDDPLRAVRAAEEMMSWLDVGNTRWESQIGAKLALGIGINTGEAVAGNIGSEKRMEYTVIGDAVNIAARLESLAQPGQIVLTKATMQRIEDEIDCVSLGERDLFGRNRPVELFAVDL